MTGDNSSIWTFDVSTSDASWRMTSSTLAGSNSGKAYVYSGATGNLLYSWEGDPLGVFLGSVAGAGDVNGDGFGAEMAPRTRPSVVAQGFAHQLPRCPRSGRAETTRRLLFISLLFLPSPPTHAWRTRLDWGPLPATSARAETTWR